MKEATGELSTTVLTIVAIAAILAIFTVFLLPTLKKQIALNQACTSGPGTYLEGKGYKIECEDAGTTCSGSNCKVCASSYVATGDDTTEETFACTYTAD